MCTTFFCPSCRRHKDLSARSDRKSSNSYVCTTCEERINKLTKPKVLKTRDGQEFTIKGQHVQTSRVNAANARALETVKWLETHVVARL